MPYFSDFWNYAPVEGRRRQKARFERKGEADEKSGIE
jgi:hypothetical protein